MSSIPEGSEYMKGRRQSVLELQDRLERAQSQGDYSTEDDVREELDRLALSVEVVRHVEIMLGFGGPTDWLDVEQYSDGDVKSVTYVYHWGTESYRTTLSESDALYQYAAGVAELATS